MVSRNDLLRRQQGRKVHRPRPALLAPLETPADAHFDEVAESGPLDVRVVSEGGVQVRQVEVLSSRHFLRKI